jgi:hypothetical protein
MVLREKAQGSFIMGEARRRQMSQRAMLNTYSDCIYCAASGTATTVEHMPPRIMFRKKDRPKGLEFPCCEVCNRNTKHADLVASLIGRVYPDAATETDGEEFVKLLGAINNNIPGLLKEMHISRAGQKIARGKVPVSLEGGYLRVGGPIVSYYMNVFAAKVGFALHFEALQRVLPITGAVFARWYSNAQYFAGQYPTEVSAMLPPPQTLKQGRKEVSDQFQFSFQHTDEGNVGVAIASFRLSFAVIAVWSADRRDIETRSTLPEHVWSPGDFVRRAQIKRTLDYSPE